MDFTIRKIRPADDPFMATIIRESLTEYGVAGEGTAFADPSLDTLSFDYQDPRSCYFVVERKGTVIGGSGIAPLRGGPADVCELQKMYLDRRARGQGIGKALLKKCLDYAREQGYVRCYLETISALKEAIRMYEDSGFCFLDHRMGDTGHYSCPVFMIRDL